METVRSNDHIRWELSNGWGHASSKKAQHNGLIFLRVLVVRLVLAERLIQALGENLIGVSRTTRIHRPWFGVVHTGFPEFPAQMRWVVGDAVAIFDECMNLTWCPGLAVFENQAELVEFCRGELRRPAAAEARPEAVNTAVIPRACPATRRGSGDPDASPGFHA